jgi:hypothetical protein
MPLLSVKSGHGNTAAILGLDTAIGVKQSALSIWGVITWGGLRIRTADDMYFALLGETLLVEFVEMGFGDVWALVGLVGARLLLPLFIRAGAGV